MWPLRHRAQQSSPIVPSLQSPSRHSELPSACGTCHENERGWCSLNSDTQTHTQHTHTCCKTMRVPPSLSQSHTDSRLASTCRNRIAVVFSFLSGGTRPWSWAPVEKRIGGPPAQLGFGHSGGFRFPTGQIRTHTLTHVSDRTDSDSFALPSWLDLDVTRQLCRST